MAMTSPSRKIIAAIDEEIAEFWPGVEIEWAHGGTHPKAKIKFAGLFKSQPIPGTPSNVGNAIKESLGQFRRAFRSMGAVRKVDEKPEDDERRIRERNDAARAERPNPVTPARATPPPTLAEQIAPAGQQRDQGGAPAGQQRDPPKSMFERLAEEPEKEEEPPLRLGPGIYDEVEGEVYHTDPAATPSLSASISKVLIKYSPMHAAFNHPRINPAFEPIDKMQFRKGRAFHTMMLGKGNPVVVLDESIGNWKTKAAQIERDSIVADGGTPLLASEHANLTAMCRAARYQFSQRDDLAYALSGGVPERIYIWEESTPSGPILCRMMVDWEAARGNLMPDLKSTKAEAFEQWGNRTMWDTGCDIQDAFYRRGFAHFNREVEAIIFAVCEIDAPYGAMTHRIDPYSQSEADHAVQFAIDMWGYCTHKNRWPGYPTATAWQTKPGYRSQNFEVRKNAGLLDAARYAEQSEMDSRIAEKAKEYRGSNNALIEGTQNNPFGLPPITENE